MKKIGEEADTHCQEYNMACTTGVSSSAAQNITERHAIEQKIGTYGLLYNLQTILGHNSAANTSQKHEIQHALIAFFNKTTIMSKL